MAKESVRSIALETPPVIEMKEGKDGEPVEGKNLTADWAKKSETAARIRAMTELAISDNAIEARGTEFDQQPMLLNVGNGTLDLTDQTLHKAERGHFLTQSANVIFDPKAVCPTWDQFLLQCMDGKQHLVEWHQVWCGYCLTGDVSEQKLIIHFGEGANGKSTFLDVFQFLMGTYGPSRQPFGFHGARARAGRCPQPGPLRTARRPRSTSPRDQREAGTEYGGSQSRHRRRQDRRPQLALRPHRIPSAI